MPSFLSGRTARAAFGLAWLVATLATAGVPLCAGADGHLAYEIGGDDCCGEAHRTLDEPRGSEEHRVAEACCGACRHENAPDGPVVSAGPDCGGCTDEIRLLDGFAHDSHAAPLPPKIPAGPLAAAATARPSARAPAPPHPPPRAPDALRC
jgi:hypothetical protein